MWRGGRGIKGDRESNELSKESLGFSLYIFYDACDLKIKSNLRPQGFSVCSSDAQKDTAHLAGWKALPYLLSHLFGVCVSCLDLD